MCYFAYVLPFGMLLLEGQNRQHGRAMCIIVYCVILVIWMVKLAKSLVVVLGDLWCMLCKQYLGITTMLICDQCSRR